MPAERVASSGGAGARFEHAASAPATVPRMAAHDTRRWRDTNDMWLILLEALAALVALLLIVWWTMFHGRTRGERRETGSSDRGPRR